MSQNVTIGGERLGSGQKMQAQLHGYDRSMMNLSYRWRSTMSPGTLCMFLHELCLPGDEHNIDLDVDVKTHPTVGPLFGSYKLQGDVFFCPLRLYQAALHNNMLGIGLNMAQVKFPVMNLGALEFNGAPDDLDNSQINPSCTLAYMGIRGIGANDTEPVAARTFQAFKLLMQWDIYKNYYANKQEGVGAVIHTQRPTIVTTVDEIRIGAEILPTIPAAPVAVNINPPNTVEVDFTGTAPIGAQLMFTLVTVDGYVTKALSDFAVLINTIAGTQTWQVDPTKLPGASIATIWGYISPYNVQPIPPKVDTFPLENIDTMRTRILQHGFGTAFAVTDQNDLPPYSWLFESGDDGIPNMLNTQEGLPIKTYNSDLFNNWIDTEFIDGVGGINDITSVDVSGGELTMDSFILAMKVFKMLNRIALSDGTYKAWLETVYDHKGYWQASTPMYVGGIMREIVFQEVISNSTTVTANGDQPLGTLAGRGILAHGQKGGKITYECSEPGYLIGFYSITPRLDYSQGNKWDNTELLTMDDLHKPQLDEIGFQDSMNEPRAWWSTKWDGSEWAQSSAGKLPAWQNYRANVSVVLGNFAIETNEMFMVLVRRYEPIASPGNTSIKDLTTYIDPVKFNHIFANTAIDAQNFWVQCAVDMTAWRKMSARIIPNL